MNVNLEAGKTDAGSFMCSPANGPWMHLEARPSDTRRHNELTFSLPHTGKQISSTDGIVFISEE